MIKTFLGIIFTASLCFAQSTVGYSRVYKPTKCIGTTHTVFCQNDGERNYRTDIAINTTIEFRVRGIPYLGAQPCMLVIGLEPLSEAWDGLWGTDRNSPCNLWTRPDLTIPHLSIPKTWNTSGSAIVRFRIPNDPSLVGKKFYSDHAWIRRLVFHYFAETRENLIGDF